MKIFLPAAIVATLGAATTASAEPPMKPGSWKHVETVFYGDERGIVRSEPEIDCLRKEDLEDYTERTWLDSYTNNFYYYTDSPANEFGVYTISRTNRVAYRDPDSGFPRYKDVKVGWGVATSIYSDGYARTELRFIGLDSSSRQEDQIGWARLVSHHMSDECE